MRSISKGSKLYSILFNKCPKCHVGKFWASDNPFKNMFFSTENSCKTCENCSLDYELETGFWYGSMYVSYAISVAVMLLFWSLTTSLFSTITTFNEILIIVIAIILVSPLNYHVSRLIWINFFIKYSK
ncbi:MAG: hypothetical protein ACI8ZH_001076 [Flavobacteriales bacterium]|jgi:uncharacterized protein (DUF983 family)|tara:strand:- start:123 stop:506 length:384 start_codon:yes stop_codon:yes gene_type:complete